MRASILASIATSLLFGGAAQAALYRVDFTADVTRAVVNGSYANQYLGTQATGYLIFDVSLSESFSATEFENRASSQSGCYHPTSSCYGAGTHAILDWSVTSAVETTTQFFSADYLTSTYIIRSEFPGGHQKAQYSTSVARRDATSTYSWEFSNVLAVVAEGINLFEDLDFTDPVSLASMNASRSLVAWTDTVTYCDVTAAPCSQTGINFLGALTSMRVSAVEPAAAEVPEPAGIGLVSTGLLALAASFRRRPAPKATMEPRQQGDGEGRTDPGPLLHRMA